MGASGDTTPEEVQAAARRLYVGLAERSEVARIEPVMEPAPDAAKSGAKVAALGAMLLQVAPAAIEAVLRMVQDLLTRPGTLPTTVTKRKGRDEVARSRVRSPAHAGEDIAALAGPVAVVVVAPCGLAGSLPNFASATGWWGGGGNVSPENRAVIAKEL